MDSLSNGTSISSKSVVKSTENLPTCKLMCDLPTCSKYFADRQMRFDVKNYLKDKCQQTDEDTTTYATISETQMGMTGEYFEESDKQNDSSSYETASDNLSSESELTFSSTKSIGVCFSYTISSINCSMASISKKSEENDKSVADDIASVNMDEFKQAINKLSEKDIETLTQRLQDYVARISDMEKRLVKIKILMPNHIKRTEAKQLKKRKASRTLTAAETHFNLNVLLKRDNINRSDTAAGGDVVNTIQIKNLQEQFSLNVLLNEYKSKNANAGDVFKECQLKVDMDCSKESAKVAADKEVKILKPNYKIFRQKLRPYPKVQSINPAKT